MDFEAVRNIIVETLGCEVEQVNIDTRLAEDLGADSLAAAEIAMTIEEELGITIEDEDLGSLKTVRDIIEYLAARA